MSTLSRVWTILWLSKVLTFSLFHRYNIYEKLDFAFIFCLFSKNKKTDRDLMQPAVHIRRMERCEVKQKNTVENIL